MFRLFECCALSFFERFVLSFSLKIERFVSDSAEIWICGLYIISVADIMRGIMLLLSIRRQGRYWQRSVRNREISGHWEMLICFTECSEPRAIRIFRYGDVRRVIVWFNCSLPMSCICIKKSAI